MIDKKLVEEYYYKKEIKNALSKETNKISKYIKNKMKEMGKSNIEVDKYNVELKVIKGKLKPKKEKLREFIQYLRDKELEDIITYDEILLKAYLKQDRLDKTEVEKYIEQTYQVHLKVDKKKV
ncbi:hypothetical protein QJR26_11750 [Clostridium baratii]